MATPFHRRRRCVWTAVCLLAAVFLVLPGANRAGEAQALTDQARMLLDYQSFVRADRDGVVRFSISAAREMQGSPMAELAVRIALYYDASSLSSVDVGEVEARRLLSSESELQPELLDVTRRFVARNLASSGRREEAMKMHQLRGLAMKWLIAGPFDNPETSRFQSREFPETGDIIEYDVLEILPDADTFREWRRKPPWRPLPDNRSFPFVRPWRVMDTATDGAMLMLTGLDMQAADNGAMFHILSDTSWRLYVDGALAAEVDKNNIEAPVEHMVPFPLTPGKRSVVLQLFPPRAGIASRNARVALRLESKAPFSWTRDIDKPAGGIPSNARREARRMKYLVELQRASADSPAVAAAFALAAAEQRMIDTAGWWAESAARAEPANTAFKVLAGALNALNPLLPPDRRRDAALTWHRAALQESPDLVPSLLYLAQVASEAEQAREASDVLEKAYEANPTSLEVLMARADWAKRFASGSTIREALDECASAFPTSASVQLAIAAMPQDGFLDMERRLEACRAALEAGPYEPEASLRLAEALADSGSRQEAESVLLGALELFAGDVGVLVRIADVYRRLSSYDEAIQVMSDAVRITPAKAVSWRTLGDLVMESGDEERARLLWRTSLAADPGQFALFDMLNYMDGNSNHYYLQGNYDAIALTAAADPERYRSDMVRLLDRSVIAFADDGSYRRFTHEVDMARTLRGGETLSRLDHRGEILTARIVFPNGNTLEPEPYPGQGGLRLPTVMPGASRDLRLLETQPTTDGKRPQVAPWYFQDPSSRTPFALSELVVRTPRNFPLVHLLHDLGTEVDFEFSQDEFADIYRWSARPPPPRHEPDAVQVSERIPSVEIGFKTTWDEIVHQELRRLDGRLIASSPMRSLVDSLQQTNLGGNPDPLRTAKAIYRYVVDNIDPSPGKPIAAHIFIDRMGDRSLLLLSLLRAAGLDAHAAAARPNTARMPSPTWELPSRDMFPVPMVRLDIPGGGVYWLDVRFDALPFGKITDDLSGAMLLAFLPEGPLFETLPDLPAEESIVYEERMLKLPAGDEPLAVSGRSVTRGIAGLERGEAMDEADTAPRRRMKLASLFPVFPDAVLKDLDILRPDDEATSRHRYEITTRILVEKRPGGVFAVSLCLENPGVIAEETRKLSRRYTTCHIGTVHIAEDRNVFMLPSGHRFIRLPRPAHIPSKFGVYQLRIVQHGDSGVEVLRNYNVPAQRISPWEWPDFLRFLDMIDLAEKQWVEYAESR